jgi:hypothetical protein
MAKVTFKQLSDQLAERVKTPDNSMHVAALAGKDLARAVLRLAIDATEVPYDYEFEAEEVREWVESLAYHLSRSGVAP